MKDLFENIDIRRILKYALYMLLSLEGQTLVLSHFRLLGVCPMIFPAVAVAVGMFNGAIQGAVFSLIMGIFADMAFVENSVFFTLLLPCLAFAAAFVSQFFINRRFFAFMGLTLLCSVLTGVLQMLGTSASDGWTGEMLGIVLMQSLWSLPFSALVYFPPARWIK